MAQCKLTAREFIINAFSPQVAAVCSTQAETACQKNNLTFIELLQPFCRLTTEGHYKDPQGTNVVIKSLHINIKDVNYVPPEPSIARKLLNDSVNLHYTERTNVVHTGEVDLEIPASVPWFEAWRDTFLSVQFPSDHEFTKHFLAAMIVVSAQDVNPLEKIQQIVAQLNLSLSGKLPKWFNNNSLRYYILIYDAIDDDKKKAEDVFMEMKNIYGASNCYFLKMNSRPYNNSTDNVHLPDPWNQFIVRQSDFSTNSDQSSSPRTPTDTTGVSSMPNSVSTEQEKSSSQAATPISNRSFPLSPDKSENITITTEIPEVQVELNTGGHEVPSVSSSTQTTTTYHPLSPEIEVAEKFGEMDINSRNDFVDNVPINANVWADSPSYAAPQHGARLSTEDLERLKMMMSEFYLKSLLPYVEKQMSTLNDLISNKKGVSRSIFSATKRWFGSNKPGVPGSVPANIVIYTAESPELQIRRLGDLCFMFGHYNLAYQAYHNAKRDFAADQAWIYYAGALEMAALSAFMMDEMIRKTIEYMDDAITTYLNTCKMPQFATRATFLSAECLKNRGLHGEAAKQLIRMTSEDSDLRSALLLEQAAYCFIPPKMLRKYAFHAVLAGHRFSKAGQKKHSLRCYKQAYQVYQNKGWTLAEDHIHFTIGRQAISLKQVEEALNVFEKLLNASSKQPALQQAAFLREYLSIHALIKEESRSSSIPLPVLPLPLVEDNEIKVLLGPTIKPGNNIELASQILTFGQDADDTRWSKLEEILVTRAQGTPPMIFKPSVAIYTSKSNNSTKPNAVVGEPIYLCIDLSNPLFIPLPLSNVRLLWSFERDGHITKNEEDPRGEKNLVDTLKIESIVIQPVSKETVVLALTPREIGQLNILGLAYDLLNPAQAPTDPTVPPTNNIAIAGKRLFDIKGPKLKNVKEKEGLSMFGNDLRLQMNILDKAPFLQVSFTHLTPELLCGELQKMEVTLTNIGSAALTNLHLGSTDPKLFAIIDHEQDFKKGKKNEELVTKIILPQANNDCLAIGESHRMTLWVCAPHKKGNHQLDLLFYYENCNKKSTPKYRLSLHSWHLTILDSIKTSAIARRSAISNDDFSALNLIVNIKNSNQLNDPFTYDIKLADIALQSKFWTLLKIVNSDQEETTVRPQESYHFLFKLSKKEDLLTEQLSHVILEKPKDLDKNVPYASFIKKRHIKALNDQPHQPQQQISQTEMDPISSTMRVDLVLILKWQAKITEGGSLVRNAIGQHYVDVNYLNKYCHHPNEKPPESIETTGRLKIFGPDANLPDPQNSIKKDQFSKTEYQKNFVWFSLEHPKKVVHDFEKSRICVVPVLVNLQNNSQVKIDVKLGTIGTSCQSHLPNIRTQLYSPQTSTNFRYAGQSTVIFQLEAHKSRRVKMQAIIPISGMYDLASRLEVSAKAENSENYISQRWKMESVCIVGSPKVSAP